ncbi:hypothetical protein COOONC_25359 [Cooperia oncophora]
MNEQKNVIAKLLDRIPERGQGDCNTTEHIALPNLMAALSNRIEKFVVRPGCRHDFLQMVFKIQGCSQKSDWLYEKIWIILSFEKYQRHVLPRDVTDNGFTEKVVLLKQLFDFKSSLFTTRYQCLELEKSHSEDFLTYTGRVNGFCERVKIYELGSDASNCRRNYETSGSHIRTESEEIEVVGTETRHTDNRARGSQPRKLGSCKSAEGRSQGKSFLQLYEKMKDCSHRRRENSATEREVSSRNRNNRGPRKQVRIVMVANAAVQANSSRVYTSML